MKTFSKIWLGIGILAIVFGLGLLLLSFIIRTDHDFELPTYSIDETYENIYRLNIDIAYGNVEIVEGEEFRIQGENLFNEKFESYVENGTWYIKDVYKNWLSFIDLSLILKGNIFERDIVPQMIITIPKDFRAENITLKVKAGDVKADTINARKGTFSVDAGLLEIGRLQVTENSSYHVGAGHMIVKQIAANDVMIDCNVGKVQIDGIITGKSKIENNVGSVIINLFGKWEDYSYDIVNNVGTITIDGERQDGMAQHRRIDNKVGNHLDIKCDVGEITIDFMENLGNIELGL